jgi:hypothetical protein
MHQRETRKPRLFGDRAPKDRMRLGRASAAIGDVTGPSSPRRVTAAAPDPKPFHELRLDDARDTSPILLLLSRR